MSEMVFPQVPVHEPARPAAEKTSSPREKRGDSQYDSVSRAEQKKLDQRHADKLKGKATSPPSEKAEAKPETTEPETKEVAAEEVQILFTFVDLQVWTSPEQQRGPAVGTGVPLTEMAGMLPGNTNGAPPGMTAMMGGLTGTDDVMSQLMQPLTDLATSAESGRFEQLHSSLTAAGSHKLPETAPALRGYTTSVELPVGHQQWGEQVVGKLTWLTAKNLSSAEIHLTPPDMGPMEVRMQVQQDQAHITVHSANQAVRDQLELNSHRLRDMLNEQGIELSGFDVADSSPNQSGQKQDAENQGAGRSESAIAGSGDEEPALASASVDLAWKGRISLYA